MAEPQMGKSWAPDDSLDDSHLPIMNTTLDIILVY